MREQDNNTILSRKIQQEIDDMQEACSEHCLHETQEKCKEYGDLIAVEQAEISCIYTRQEIIRHILKPFLKEALKV